VAGHGLEAAMTMGQMRSAARALAPACQPAELLAALDHFICRTIADPLATAAAVVVDPAGRTMRYCMAGHPAPLMRGPDGSVTTLSEGGGILLGLEWGDRPEGVLTFAPGSALVLFTDGLVERRGDASVESGICRLAGDSLFRKTSCAVSFAHGMPDYNGHYGIRELCDICPMSQIGLCAQAHRIPSAAKIQETASTLPEARPA